MEAGEAHRIPGELTRRGLLARASALGAGALVAQALPIVEALGPAPALAAPSLLDGTLQAFADTMIPGRRVALTARGNEVHPRAIAGVDPLPGAVEADALELYHHRKIGFDALAPVLLAELEARSLPRGGHFLALPFDDRVAVCVGGLAFSNPLRVVWEAGAAVPFTAFCAAALTPEQTAETAPGYAVMGHPGAAPHGYPDASYGIPLATERTAKGYLE